jgi:hypothetical protein
MWFNLAAAMSTDGNAKLAAKNRDIMTKTLTRELRQRSAEVRIRGAHPVLDLAGKWNRSLDNPARKFRILKNHRAETCARNLGLQRETPDIPRQRPDFWRLTYGNVATSVSTRNPWRETAVAG